MFENATHVRRLVSIRTTYKDALIYGSQINQPGTDNPNVVAYQYQGSTHRILTIVNISDDNATANIRLDTPDPGGIWKDLLNRRSYHTNSSGVFENVTLETGQGSLLILLHTVFSPTNPKSV
jgi:glycosidase